MTCLLDVLTYIIYIIKEIAEGIQHEVGLAGILFLLWIRQDTDALRLDMYVDLPACHDGIAVVMDGSRFTALDMQTLRSESLDLRVVTQCLHKEVGCYLWGIERIERLHDDDVQLSILHRGTWCDIGVVAVLRSMR